MRQRLYHRLRQLEQVSARARNLAEARQRQADGKRGLDKLRLFLRLRDVEQSPIESLAEASARAPEISCRELRKQLEAGVDPIHKWFTDHGIFEEVEKRQAAGTWPTAGGSDAFVRL